MVPDYSHGLGYIFAGSNFSIHVRRASNFSDSLTPATYTYRFGRYSRPHAIKNDASLCTGSIITPFFTFSPHSTFRNETF